MKKLFFVLLVAFLGLSVHAQLLWKITDQSGVAPSYVFGTHHLIPADQIPDFDSIIAYVKSVDAVVGEMDMSNKTSMQFKMLKAAMMKDTTISQLVSAEDYDLIDTELKSVLGYGLKPLARMKPMLVTSMYTVMLYMKQNNLSKEPEAVDEKIQKKGRQLKKQIIGLETIDDQIDILFNSMSYKRQAEILLEAVKNKDLSQDQTAQLNEAYLQGDLEEMQRLSDEENDMTADEMKVLVDNRNQKWMSKLIPLFREKPCFVAVGCLHLSGDHGLLQLLRNAGFDVEAVEL